MHRKSLGFALQASQLSMALQTGSQHVSKAEKGGKLGFCGNVKARISAPHQDRLTGKSEKSASIKILKAMTKLAPGLISSSGTLLPHEW